jgi:hypothetical protein
LDTRLNKHTAGCDTNLTGTNTLPVEETNYSAAGIDTKVGELAQSTP